jgi:hypothetical protein
VSFQDSDNDDNFEEDEDEEDEDEEGENEEDEDEEGENEEDEDEEGEIDEEDEDEEDEDEEDEDEEGEIDEEDDLVFETRAEVFSRAWAAWKVAEDTLTRDRSVFGPQSFGLIALGMLLDVIKDATTDPY